MKILTILCINIVTIICCAIGANAIDIGDPKELFLKKIPEKYSSDYIHERETPTSYAEFSKYFNHDFEIFKKNISTLDEDLKNNFHQVFEDPDFIPPERPDWR